MRVLLNAVLAPAKVKLTGQTAPGALRRR